jgi:para-nitrobenzyl esterase
LAVALGTAATVNSAEPPVVRVDGGALAGVETDGLRLFRGIPYAAAPVADRRWRPPAPAPRWEGVRDASVFGAYCPQNLKPGYSLEALAGHRMSEDCLNLNVWTPADNATEKRPVMVWILPGSFRRGATALPRYDGSALAKQGAVVVTFEYRMGLLGQFAHPALAAEQPGAPLGNYYLMDQLAALRWVQRNIGVFGGDPGNVTIFGMSAGGVSVNYLMAMQAAAGLFHRAISQSSGIRVSAPRRLAETVNGVAGLEADGLKLAAHSGIEGEGPEAAAALRALPLEQLLEYQANPRLFSPGSLNPVLDGVLVVESVGEAFRRGRQHAVPYMAGATS